jgi:chromosome segregation ATPase
MEKNYINYYIEIMTSTMNDAVARNISLQANAKMADIAIGQLNEKIIELEGEINRYNNNTSSVEENYRNQIGEYEKRITDLNTEISKLNALKSDYGNIKNKVSHIDTFKNELSKERDLHQNTRNAYESQIKNLNDKITTLKSQIQNTPNSKETEVINLRNQIQDVQNQKNNEINNLKNVIENLNKEKTELNVVINNIRNEYNSIKLQVDHIETFKNQIIQMQQTLLEKNSTIDDLNIKLNELKSSTKKKKKIFENTSILEEINSSLDLTTEETNRDGGSF